MTDRDNPPLKPCSHPGCAAAGTNLLDFSIQLPDYRYFCEPHAKLAEAKQTRDFRMNMLRLEVSGLRRDMLRNLDALDKAVAELEKPDA